MLPEILLYIVVLLVLGVLLYPAQTAIALVFNGPIGIITAWVALLNEVAVTVQFISQLLLLPKPLRVMFDTILSREGLDDLVVKGKLRKFVEPTPLDQLKKKMRNLPKKLIWPTWTIKAATKLILHFIPILGPIVLVASQGPKMAQECHERYFQLKGFDAKKRKSYVTSRRAQYMGFGVVAAGLEAIPVLGFVFSFTNCAGAALWAAQVEKDEQKAKKLLELEDQPEQQFIEKMLPENLKLSETTIFETEPEPERVVVLSSNDEDRYLHVS